VAGSRSHAKAYEMYLARIFHHPILNWAILHKLIQKVSTSENVGQGTPRYCNQPSRRGLAEKHDKQKGSNGIFHLFSHSKLYKADGSDLAHVYGYSQTLLPARVWG
jgi:hypothetical protein